jgi:hypothetical protein
MLLLACAGVIGAVLCAHAAPVAMHRPSAAVTAINFGDWFMLDFSAWKGGQAVFPTGCGRQRAQPAPGHVHERLRTDPDRRVIQHAMAVVTGGMGQTGPRDGDYASR